MLRSLLRTLALDFGASPGLERYVPKIPEPGPRNVTVTGDEKEMILRAASPSLRCFLLLCSDLAIRSGTAVTIAPQHYNRERNELSFTTKKGAAVTLQVTAELRRIFESAERCPSNTSYVAFLSTKARRKGTISAASCVQTYNLLKRNLGIDRRFTPHDYRRTTAVRVLEVTGDIRQVQATLGHKRLRNTVHYLDHNLTKVSVATLELAKLPPTTETIQ